MARLMAQKNHTRLLDIFAALKKVRPDSCLLLVGEGELRAELEAKAARLGIAQDVKFLGVQSDTSVWYQVMDVFVMPSLFEGLPVVGMEAQASKVVDAGRPPAGPVIGGRAGNELFAEPFDRQLGVLGQTGVVGVGDAQRHRPGSLWLPAGGAGKAAGRIWPER